eukprot:8935940-Pyramimonas_sp.AAC.1
MAPTPRGSELAALPATDPGADSLAGGRPSPPGRVNPLRNAFLDRLEGRSSDLPAQPAAARHVFGPLATVNYGAPSQNPSRSPSELSAQAQGLQPQQQPGPAAFHPFGGQQPQAGQPLQPPDRVGVNLAE